MPFFRYTAMVLPQLLIFLLLAATRDMLGGWNQTDEAMVTVRILVLLSPSVSLALLVTEIVRCYKAKKGERDRTFLYIRVGTNSLCRGTSYRSLLPVTTQDVAPL